MRFGFILGFLIGGAIATLLGKTSEVEAPSLSGTADARVNPIKQHVQEAREAAKEAQMEKESELLRMYDDMVRRKGSPGQ